MEDYNFARIGKQMPYRVPDGFFDGFESMIIDETRRRHRQGKHRTLKFICRSIAGAAAIALLIIAFHPVLPEEESDFSEIILAFDSMTDSDRNLMFELYDDDIFINP